MAITAALTAFSGRAMLAEAGSAAVFTASAVLFAVGFRPLVGKALDYVEGPLPDDADRTKG